MIIFDFYSHVENAKEPHILSHGADQQLLALAHNTLVDLRTKVDGGEELKSQPSLKPIKGEGGWSVLATTFAMGRLKPSLARFRAFALKLANTVLEHSRSQWLRLNPQHLRPAWAAALLAG